MSVEAVSALDDLELLTPDDEQHEITLRRAAELAEAVRDVLAIPFDEDPSAEAERSSMRDRPEVEENEET